MPSHSTKKETLGKGYIKKPSSIDHNITEGDGVSRRNEGSARSASVPSVVYQEDISVKHLPRTPSTNKAEPLTTKMRLLITSCDENTNEDGNAKEGEGWNNKSSDSEHIEVMQDRKESSEKDSLEESEESDWFNSDLSTPEYPSRRNSYNSTSKRSSIETYGDMSMNSDPWPINMLSSGSSSTSIVRPFSPTFGGRKLSGGGYSAGVGTCKSSLLNVPSLDDNVFKQEAEGHYIGGVEMRPISTASASSRRRSTSSLHVLQARYRKFSLK